MVDVSQIGESLDYKALMLEAMRDVMRKALERVAISGLPGAHHFLITFRTDHSGVDLPAHLREAQGDEMTIVLQHQFEDLVVDAEGFSVLLHFSGKPARIEIPFEAVTSFVDPHAHFGLQYEGKLMAEEEDESKQESKQKDKQKSKQKSKQKAKQKTSGKADKAGGQVVDLDAFRPKR